MQHRRPACTVLAVALSPLVALVLAFAGATGPLSAQGLIPLRVATTPSDSGAEVYYAIDKGFFREHGLDVQVTTLANGGVIAAGVSSGEFQFAQTAVPSIASAYANGVRFTIVAPASRWKSGDPIWSAIIVPKTSAIKNAHDLNGKTVAVQQVLNFQQVAASAWIDKNGGDSTQVRYIEIPFAEMAAALAANRVDAATESSPALDSALQENRVLGESYDALGAEVLISAWMSTRDYAKANPDVVKRFAAAIMETAVWANKNHAESAQILEKYTKVHLAATAARVVYPAETNAAMIQPVIDASVRYKALKAAFPASEILLAP